MTTETTVDPREVEFYTGLAETWWDETGPFWPLHRLNALRVKFLRDELCDFFCRNPESPRPLAGLTILDVGCGGGILSESMAALGATVTGIDVVDKNIAVARLHARERGFDIEYAKQTAESMAGSDRRFDVVLSMEVVEHVADVPTFMHACTRLTAPGGVMAVATINRNPLSWLFAIVGAEYVLGWLPRGTHQWRRFVKPAEAQRLMSADGLTVRRKAGVAVNPLTRSFSLTRNMLVNYMLVATRR